MSWNALEVQISASSGDVVRQGGVGGTGDAGFTENGRHGNSCHQLENPGMEGDQDERGGRMGASGTRVKWASLKEHGWVGDAWRSSDESRP